MVVIARLLIIIFCCSMAHAVNIDSQDFWNGWQRDNALEESIANVVNEKRLSAQELERMATSANPEHSFYLGVLYYLGGRQFSGVIFPRNHQKALSYFQNSRANPQLQACSDYYIGMILLNGQDGATHDPTSAKQTFKRSHTPESYLMLAALSYEDPAEQLSWYKMLAYTGDWRAMLTVARWHEIGRGGSKNFGEAYYWYSQACMLRVQYGCEKAAELKE